MPQQILHTERITLVPLADGHLAWEAELDSDPEAMRYLGALEIAGARPRVRPRLGEGAAPDRPGLVEGAHMVVAAIRVASSRTSSTDCSLSFTSRMQSSGRSPTSSANRAKASMSIVSACAPGRFPGA